MLNRIRVVVVRVETLPLYSHLGKSDTFNSDRAASSEGGLFCFNSRYTLKHITTFGLIKHM